MNMENTGSIPSVSSDTSALPAIDDGHLEGLEKGSAALLVRSGPQRNERFILSGQQITLGRSDESNFMHLLLKVLPDGKLKIKEA